MTETARFKKLAKNDGKKAAGPVATGKITESFIDRHCRWILPGDGVYKFLRIPAWIPPEAIVLLGFAFSCAAGYAFSIAPHNPTFALLAILAVYGNLLADHMDGRHARATGQCRNGGEILDHFFDPLSFSVITVGLAYGVNRLDLAIVTILGIYGNVSTVFQEAKMLQRLTLKTVGPAEARFLFMSFALSLYFIFTYQGEQQAVWFQTAFLYGTGVLTLGQMVIELIRTVDRVNREGPPPDNRPWVVAH